MKNRLDMAKKRIKELEDMSVESSKTEMWREKKNEKDGIDYLKIVMGIPGEENRKEYKKYLKK